MRRLVVGAFLSLFRCGSLGTESSDRTLVKGGAGFIGAGLVRMIVRKFSA